MRARTLLLILAAALVAAFALVNREEIMRPSTLNLVWTQVQAPLGLLLLGLLALAVVVSLASGVSLRARHRQEADELAGRLQSQRDLADRAEASRFVDLRQMLDTHLKETKQKDAGLATLMDQGLARHQRETRTQLEGLHRAIGTRLGEMEARLEARLVAESPRGEWTAAPSQAATRDTGHPAIWSEPGLSAEGGALSSDAATGSEPALEVRQRQR